MTIAMIDETRFQGSRWIWPVVWVALTLLGIIVQLRNMRGSRLPEERWVRAQSMET